MNEVHLAALFTSDTRAEPALPADFTEATLAHARRSVRRRRLWSSVGTAALVLVLVALIGVVPRLDRTPAPTPADPTRPSLPAEFAELSRFTARAVDRPAGRAIALYEYGEVDGVWQTLVAGADRDTYRRVDTDEDESPAVLLSPDGRYVLYFKASRGTDEFRLLDLTTGRSEVRHSVEWMSNVGAGISLLAWSPDGRYVAYAVPHPSPNDGRAESSLRGSLSLRDVAILDVVNDTNVLFSLNTPVFGAAFSPDSERVAVLGDPESPIISLDGAQVGTWSAPASPVGNTYRDAVAPLAWSPDGTLLAVSGIEFVDLTGAGRAFRSDLTGDLLGWRSPTSIVVRSSVDEGIQALVEVSIVDGNRTVLSRFPRTEGCRSTGPCVYSMQLATNLLPQAGIRPSNPDLGPWARVVPAGSILVAAFVLAALVAMIWRGRARRTRRMLT